jgi:GNAT superfamily N-acetyltransferase
MRVAMLLEEELRDSTLEPPRLQKAIEAWLRPRLNAGDFGAFLAFRAGEPAGSGGVSIYEVPPGPGATGCEAYVMSMYTLPAQRGRGVARAVLAAPLAFAGDAGAARVWLRASAMGRPIYERAGFRGRDHYMQLRLSRAQH